MKKKKDTKTISTSSDSSEILDCNGTKVGDVGYKFHKTFNVGEGKTETTAIFHGEVIHVRDLNGASSK